MNKILVFLIVLVVIGVGSFFFFTREVNDIDVDLEEENPVEVATTTEEEVVENEPETVIGSSVSGEDIVAYHFGEGEDELLFVGGIHGGYSWNTALVASRLVKDLQSGNVVIPENIKVTVIPVLNPDGLKKVVGTIGGDFTQADVTRSETLKLEGRFNANSVDLNRNFDCKWQPESLWRSKVVSAGTAPFSEPESAAVRDYVEDNNIKAVVAWYSAAGGVYASSCESGVLAETTKIMNIYAKASGYPAYKDFDYYEITGDMMNWLAKKNVPAISVLLTNHSDIEWSKNKNGIDAILEFYAQ
ncbi:MAG: M14 family metallopeptidase [Candidatus Paceibacterota bacterium]